MTARKGPKNPGDLAELDSARSTQAERREAAERAILEAAKQIVAEKGLDELTLNEAGELAGYSRALPAHYFKTKSALLAALADHIMESYSIRVREAIEPSDGIERLLERVAFIFDDGCRNPQSLRAFQAILAGGLTRPELAPLVARLNHESIDGFASLIKRARERGEVRANARPRAEASIILASIRGVMFQWLIDPNHVPLSRVRDSLVENIRKSLAP
ncbi:MAG TPA: TetR/AcrR family transcriptional regulator [Hyphomonadaceae bacterium]|nr:TetR/AcrR family transcriptional regulator [Hyphomonadaceae bacterium]